jgi:hypothetical protein
MPPKLSSTNSITAGIGFLIDQEETFMAWPARPPEGRCAPPRGAVMNVVKSVGAS